MSSSSSSSPAAPSQLTAEDKFTLPTISHIKEQYHKGGITALFAIYCKIVETTANLVMGYKFREMGHSTADVVAQEDVIKTLFRVLCLPRSTAEEILNDDKSSLLQSLTTCLLTLLLSVGLFFLILTPHLWRIGASIMCFAIFHLLEYLFLAMYHPKEPNYKQFALSVRGLTWLRCLPLFEHIFLLLISNSYYIMITGGVPQQLQQETTTTTLYTMMFFISSCGLFLTFLSQILRSAAIQNLGINFQYNLARPTEKQTHHALITTGVHGIMRHPSYTALLLYFLAQALLTLSPTGLFVAIFAAYPLFLARIEEEEKFLIEMYGEDYLQYRHHTPAFFPTFDGLKTFFLLKPSSSGAVVGSLQRKDKVEEKQKKKAWD